MSEYSLQRTASKFYHVRHGAPEKQGGVALVVALVLLVLVTLVGLAAIRGTTMQQKMTANFYDREVAFQSSEAALRAAETIIFNTQPPPAYVYNCAPLSGNVCLSNPFTDPQLPANAIQTVATGSAASEFTASAVSVGQPQFVVENMGAFADPSANPATIVTSNGLQYDLAVGSGGNPPPAGQSTYYQITARSSDPAKANDRAVVTLQAMVKK